jgi:tripartite-type tricarboxylate transporter receptor subunit TctC
MLAVGSPQRMQAVPELPTMAEAGVPGVELLTWFAAFVPAATPRPIVERINGWFNQVLATEETRKFLNSFGGDPFITTPDEGQALLRQSVKDWERYMRAAHIEPQ